MWLLVAGLLLVHNAAGSVLPDSRSSIINGRDAPDSRWPWVARLWFTNGIRYWQCAGTILNKQWIMTAAYCLRTQLLPPLTDFSFARIGGNDLRKSSKFYTPLSKFEPHPNYRGIHNNIALVMLGEEISFSPTVAAMPLPAPGEQFGAKSECWIAGWGNIEEAYFNFDMRLKQRSVPLIRQDTCENLFPRLTSAMICAGSNDGEQITSDGDVGGPLVCEGTCGLVQVGIISTQADDECDSNFHGVYTRVSHYLEQIREIIGEGGSGSGSGDYDDEDL